MPDDLNFSPVGYEPIDAAWWPEIAAAILKPWPRAAAMMDLRWWRGQEAATRKLRMKRVATMPGRPTLTERWGWTDWEVKKLLRAEADWSDLARQAPESASVPPATHQQTASVPPADTRTNADNAAEPASVPPAFRQPPASETPRARVFTVTPITVTPIEGTTDPRSADAAPGGITNPEKWALLSGEATPTPDPAAPEAPTGKPKRAKAAKAKKEPHPFHERVIKAWERCLKERHETLGLTDPIPSLTSAEVMMLCTCVRDRFVSRDEAQGVADMQRVGAAMRRYLSQRVDGTYVKGLSVKGFCGDVAKWMTPVDVSPAPTRPGPAASTADRRRAALDMLDNALDRLANPHGNVVTIPANDPTEPACLLLPAR